MKHRLRYYTIIVGLFLLGHAAKAQYVTIPDTSFVNWLSSHGYAGCMNGNQLDTACGAVLSAVALNCYAVPIRDLTGIQYFKNLDTLDCSNDSLYSIPALPSSLVYLDVEYNNLSTLPMLPNSLHNLNCAYNFLDSLPSLPGNLYVLYCFYNQLIKLPALPGTLLELSCPHNYLPSLPLLPGGLANLICDYNPLDTLPDLPNSLRSLSCQKNNLTSLPVLPSNLNELNCDSNNISDLPALPGTLDVIYCDFNQLTSLPILPAALVTLSCDFNQLTSLPALPASLTYLSCTSNQLTSLPLLPIGLWQGLYCILNQLTTLPPLPPVLQRLYCDYNSLTSLPNLPGSLTYLSCVENPQLASIPTLPDSMFYLDCDGDSNLTCLPELKRIEYLSFQGTAVTCLPDYGSVTSSTPTLNTVPLCGIYNPTGCQPFWNVSGQNFYDQNNDCQFDSIDVGTNYVKTQLYSGGTLVQQTFSGGEGFYSFDSVANGSYTVQVDTSNLPFTVSCPDSDYYTVSLTPTDTLSYNNNFAFKCRTQGFDVGVQSVLNNYVTPRPNSIFTLNTIAGDMSELYGAHCAAGISGQVQISFNGQLSYVGPATGALTPTTVNGNTISWTIADYGAVNDFTAFNLLFKVDSLATAGSSLCFTVTVTPTAGDYNPSNNTLTYCFPVVASLDPNEKEVYPSGNTDTSVHWLTYTIRFQNTGTAPAQNVRITDTLGDFLDASTFQLLAYSAKNLTQIFGNDIVFNFPNINLPDSATSDSASRGFVQFKIMILHNLPLFTQITNTADIYFDLNPAVVTNTTVNTISIPAGIAPVSGELNMQLYPNPAKNYVIVETDENAVGGMLQITDVAGREIAKMQITNSKLRIPTSALTGGVYLVKVCDLNGRTGVGKLVVRPL